MDVEFDDDALERLEWDPSATAGHGDSVDRGFRKVMQAIRAAVDERDLYALKGLRFEKLKGKRQHQHSLRLNDQWRLVVDVRGERSHKRIGVIAVEDYH